MKKPGPRSMRQTYLQCKQLLSWDRAQTRARRSLRLAELLRKITGQRGDGRVIRDERHGERDVQRVAQALGRIDRQERVEAELLEALIRVQGKAALEAHDAPDDGAHSV